MVVTLATFQPDSGTVDMNAVAVLVDNSNAAALKQRSKPLPGNLDVQGCSKDDVPSDGLSALLKLGG